VRKQLLAEVHKSLIDGDRKFLLSFKKGEPVWELLPLPDLKNLPAVQWKLINIQNLIRTKPHKHEEMRRRLEEGLA